MVANAFALPLFDLPPAVDRPRIVRRATKSTHVEAPANVLSLFDYMERQRQEALRAQVLEREERQAGEADKRLEQKIRKHRRMERKYSALLAQLPPATPLEHQLTLAVSRLLVGDALRYGTRWLVCCKSDGGKTYYMLFEYHRLVAKACVVFHSRPYLRYVYALIGRQLAAHGFKCAERVHIGSEQIQRLTGVRKPSLLKLVGE